MSQKQTPQPGLNTSILSSPKYSGKTVKFKFLCSIVDAMTANSICDSSQYDTLSTVIKTFHLEGPSGNLSLRSRIPDVQGQIGVPQLVDQILGSLNC